VLGLGNQVAARVLAESVEDVRAVRGKRSLPALQDFDARLETAGGPAALCFAQLARAPPDLVRCGHPEFVVELAVARVADAYGFHARESNLPRGT
jgi:hypothetical protein